MATKKSAARKTVGSKRNKPENFEEYSATVPSNARAMLNKLREAIRSVLPRAATETISYGIPAFKNDGIIVWYAAFSDHCSLFPTAAVIEDFKEELKNFSTSKGTIHFSLDRPLPVGLIKKMVKARVNQREA